LLKSLPLFEEPVMAGLEAGLKLFLGYLMGRCAPPSWKYLATHFRLAHEGSAAWQELLDGVATPQTNPFRHDRVIRELVLPLAKEPSIAASAEELRDALERRLVDYLHVCDVDRTRS
jgi:hypothetical protein